MQGVENPDDFRRNIKIHLKRIVNSSKIVENIEKGIFNYAIQEANKRKLIKKWCNPHFVLLYKDRLRTVFFNLNTEDMIKRIIF